MERTRTLLTLAAMAVLISVMSVVDVSTKALAPYLSRSKRATAGSARRLMAFRAWRQLGSSLATALLLCGMFPLGGGSALTESQHTGAFLISEAPSLRSRDQVTVLSGQNLKAGAVVGRVKYGIGGASIPAVVGTGDGVMTEVFCGPEVEVGNYVVTCITEAANNGTFSVTTPSGKALPNAVMAAGSVVYTSRHINFTITDGSADFDADDVFTIVVSTTAPTVIGGTGTGVMTALSLGPDAKPGNYRVINRVVIAAGGDFEVIGPDGDSIGRFNWAASGSTAAFTSRQINFTLSDATDYIAGNYFDVAVFNTLNGGKAVAWDPAVFDGRHRVAGVLWADVDATAADKLGTIINADAEVRGADLIYAAAITVSQKASAALDLKALGIKVRS